MSAKVAEKDLELIVRVDPQLPKTMLGDVGRIRQIVTNLLGNAVKFTEKGHVFVNASGSVDADGMTQLNVAVEDNNYIYRWKKDLMTRNVYVMSIMQWSKNVNRVYKNVIVSLITDIC